MNGLATLLFAAVLALVFSANPALAATPQLPAELEHEARAIEYLLQCPVCKGQTVAESRSGVAVEMKEKIRQMLAEGKSRRQVLDYYVGRYGDWILTKPPARGAGIVAWVMPPAFVLVGLAILFSFIRRSGARRAADKGQAQAVNPAGAETQEQLYSRLKDYI